MAKTEIELLVDIAEKVDIVCEKVHSLDITVAKQEVNLQDHMRRTEINEQRLELFEEKIAPALDAYKFVVTLFKIAVGVATIAGIYYKLKS